VPGLLFLLGITRQFGWGCGLLACTAVFSLAPFLQKSGAQAAEPASSHGDQKHWAFQKPIRSSIPDMPENAHVATPVDAFILNQLTKAGLRPAKPADRITLLRRITFDLTGLPPTPEEVERFLADDRPDAYALLVERLLASPHYGERWAQHWLDLTRYADSNGYEADGDRPNAWRYRDYVIRSFNENKPFDRFIMEQIAGDLLPRHPDPARQTDQLVATGFHRCGPIHIVSGNLDKDEVRYEQLTEMTGAVGSVFLGLTLNCARCHDHKFDPLTQADYFRVQAFFAAAQPRDADLSDAETKANLVKREADWKKEVDPILQRLHELEEPYRARLREEKEAKLETEVRAAVQTDPKQRTPAQKKLAADAEGFLKISWDEVVERLTAADRDRRAALRERLRTLESRRPPPLPQAWSVADTEPVPLTHILKRGNLDQKKERVEPAFPRALAGVAAKENDTPSTPETAASRLTRLDQARWLTSPDNPLTARVIVNRLWQHHFGRGLVGTPNDFGARGSPPTHPELLDWLACELIESGWSLKHMHRLMVLSNAYQQASRLSTDAPARRLDPDNLLLGRMNRRRRDGEALRDGILAVSGRLNLLAGGPPVRIPLEPEVYDLIFTESEPDNLWPVTADPREHTRRSIYLLAKRNVRLPLFESFDQPDRLNSCPERSVSTFAPQALLLLNGSIIQSESKHFAARLLRECGEDVEKQVERAYFLTLARRPTAEERRRATTFLADQADLLRDRLRARLPIPTLEALPDGSDPATAFALADFCLAMLNQNEFLYLD
jgi:hypothetical protein